MLPPSLSFEMLTCDNLVNVFSKKKVVKRLQNILHKTRIGGEFQAGDMTCIRPIALTLFFNTRLKAALAMLLVIPRSGLLYNN